MLDFNWYGDLVKPLFSPPAWVFSPVWIILYITIAISFLIILFKRSELSKSDSIMWFIVQIILNIVWTPVFFGMKNITLALAILILLDFSVFMTIKSFYNLSKIAGMLLIPYFVWILFATYLNAGLLLLN